MTSRLWNGAKRLGVLLVLPLFLGPVFVVSATSAQAAVVPSAAATWAYENRVESLINVQRAKYKLGRLAWSPCPDRYAESWGAYLARTGRFYHQSLTPILRGCSATRVAENLARGYTTADRTVAAWMASPGHRANILDPRLTRCSVAAVYARGQWTVVADFIRS
jgi:uncharacterized protein YkwD